MVEGRQANEPTLEGRLQPRTRSRVLRVLGALSGVLLLWAAVRLVAGWIMGLRRPCSVSLDESGMVISSRTYLAGRVIRTSSMRITPWNVKAVEREERFRYAHVLAGALFFLLGVGLGFGLFVEWALTRFGMYLLLGLGAVALGVALDLAIVFLVPAVRRRSAVLVYTSRRIWRVDDVVDGNAEAFLEHAERWIERNATGTAPPADREKRPRRTTS
jgi:hypothetical protein